MKHYKIGLILGSVALSFGVFAFANSTSKKENAIKVDAADYYASITDSMSGTTLLNNLKSIINTSSVSVSYNWSRYEAADEDPNNNSNVILIYARNSVAKTAHVSGSTGWNREHTFPQSKLSNSQAESDNHIIFASDNKVNGARGNIKMGVVSGGTVVNDYFGNATTCRKTSSLFDPNNVARGIVARSTMYAAAMYGYDPEDNFESIATMLRWHLEYQPDANDVRRNNTVYSNQKNRNPFVDHPEYACRIWGNTNSTTQSICGSTGSVSISKSTASIEEGSSTTISATSSNSSTITWTTSNANVASLSASSSSSGSSITITGVSAGSATITAKATIDSTQYTANCTVTVTQSGGDSGEESYEQLTSISSIDSSAKYVLGLEGTGFHYAGTTSWGSTASPDSQTPLYYTLTKGSGNTSFTAKTTINNTEYYLTVPTSNTFSMSTSSTSIKLGTTTTPLTGENASYAVTNTSTTTRHLRINGANGLRSYAGTTGVMAYFYKVNEGGGDDPTPTLNSISLDTSNVQTTFTVGDTFSYSGLVVTAHYSDNTNPVITTGYTVSTPNMSIAGTKTVTVTYNSQTATYTITVNSGDTPEPTGNYSLTSGSPYINGVAYRMYFTKSSANYYFDGTIANNYYGSTSGDPIDVYFEENGNGQNIYFFDINTSNKTFITLTNASYRNFTISTTTPSTPWVYSSTEETLTFSINGTPYYTGADSSHDTFTGKNVVYKAQFVTSSNEGAIAFATIMNDYITCNNSGTTAPTFRTGFAWTSFANVYANLDSTSQSLLKSNNPTNTEVAEYVARYDYIVGKYGTSTYSDFIGRNPSPIGNHRFSMFASEMTNNATAIIVVIASILAISTFAGYFIVRRKKHQ